MNFTNRIYGLVDKQIFNFGDIVGEVKDEVCGNYGPYITTFARRACNSFVPIGGKDE